MYGWDIMPRIVSAGLWRDVRLEFSPSVRFSSVHWFTRSVDIEHAKAVVTVNWELEGALTEHDGYSLEIVLSHEGHTIFRSGTKAASIKGQLNCSLEKVEHWWPRGYGKASALSGDCNTNGFQR